MYKDWFILWILIEFVITFKVSIERFFGVFWYVNGSYISLL